MIRGPLTAELSTKDSPVRRFLDERFTSGLRDVQRRYREANPALAVPSADRQEANPGTAGTAADWLLRFMLHPQVQCCGICCSSFALLTFRRAESSIELV